MTACGRCSRAGSRGATVAGRLHIVRRIESPRRGNDVDTAVFSEPRANYDLSPLSTTEMTVTHARGSLADGTDTLKHIERLRFADQVVVVGGPANAPAGGTVTISDTTPVENPALTVSEAVTDANGVNRRRSRSPGRPSRATAAGHGRHGRDVHAR